MVPRNKYLTGSVFLSLSIAPYLFFTIVLLQQQYLKSTVEARLATKDIQIVAVSAQEVTWVHYEEEVIIEGKLFDVIQIKKSGSSLLLYGWFDEAEIELEESVANASKEKEDKNSIGFEQLFQLLQNSFFYPQSEGHFASIKENKFSPFTSGNKIRWYASVPSPPPQTSPLI
ncbi:MAG: hypothetical protein ABIN57_03230 [Chitinophagaceae bacterium]